jgi:hypothetical protein
MKNLFVLLFVVLAFDSASACMSNISKRIEITVRLPGREAIVIDRMAANESYTVILNTPLKSLQNAAEVGAVEEGKGVSIYLDRRKKEIEVKFMNESGEERTQKIQIKQIDPQYRC